MLAICRHDGGEQGCVLFAFAAADL